MLYVIQVIIFVLILRETTLQEPERQTHGSTSFAHSTAFKLCMGEREPQKRIPFPSAT